MKYKSLQGRPQCLVARYQQGTRREQRLCPAGAERAPAPPYALLQNSAQSSVLGTCRGNSSGGKLQSLKYQREEGKRSHCSSLVPISFQPFLSLPPIKSSNESSLTDQLKYTATLITVLKNNQSST